MFARQHIGEMLRKARKASKQTQKQVSKTTGIHSSTLSEIENGRFTGSLDIFERYLDAMGLELAATEKRHRLPDWDEIDELFGEDL